MGGDGGLGDEDELCAVWSQCEVRTKESRYSLQISIVLKRDEVKSGWRRLRGLYPTVSNNI